MNVHRIPRLTVRTLFLLALALILSTAMFARVNTNAYPTARIKCLSHSPHQGQN